MIQYQIEPVSYGVLGDADNITIEVMNYELGATSASVAVRFNMGTTTLERRIVEIPAELYAQWGTDDSIIVDHVITTLQLTTIE